MQDSYNKPSLTITAKKIDSLVPFACLLIAIITRCIGEEPMWTNIVIALIIIWLAVAYGPHTFTMNFKSKSITIRKRFLFLCRTRKKTAPFGIKKVVQSQADDYPKTVKIYFSTGEIWLLPSGAVGKIDQITYAIAAMEAG